MLDPTLVVYATCRFVAGASTPMPLFEQTMLLGPFGLALASAIGTLIARSLMLVQPARRGDLDLRSAPGRARHARGLARVLGDRGIDRDLRPRALLPAQQAHLSARVPARRGDPARGPLARAIAPASA